MPTKMTLGTAAALVVVIVAIAILFSLLIQDESKPEEPLMTGNTEKIEVGERIMLPKPRYASATSVEKALLERRSVRAYSGEDPLVIEELSQLLWAAQGITAPWGGRTAPSAGALYPLELYVVIGDVEGVDDGVYRYKPTDHALEKVLDGDVRAELADAALGQESIRAAAIDIVFTAVYARTTVKYRERGVRYAHMEAGHAAQNVYLQAVALDLGTVTVGAFVDSDVKAIMNLEEQEEPLYIMPVGRLG